MSKERWFFHYERLCAEREIDWTDDKAVERAADDAYDAVRDESAARADYIKDRAKEGK